MIVLIGGTGDVDNRLVSLLLDHTAASVLVVSRRGRASDDRVKTLRLNIAATDAAARIPLGATVVNLTEATPPSVAADVVRAGGNFLETSASPDYVELIIQEVSANGGAGTGVVCVGAAPEWSIGALGDKYRVSGVTSPTVRPGDLRRRFTFERGGRSRKALGVGFAQQGVVGQSGRHSHVRVRTFLALHPPYATHLTGLLLRLGLGPALARHKRGLTRILMRLPPPGRVGTRIAVEAQGPDGGILAARHVAAGVQAEITAAMILAAIRAVNAGEKPLRGSTTIVDHLTLTEAFDALHQFLPEMPIEAWSGGAAEDRA